MDCNGEPRIEEIVPGILTVMCPKCGDTWNTPKTTTTTTRRK